MRVATFALLTFTTLLGYLPEREVMTGIGPVAVRCPRVRDRVGEGSERIRFSSAILPPYGAGRRASRC